MKFVIATIFAAVALAAEEKKEEAKAEVKEVSEALKACATAAAATLKKNTEDNTACTGAKKADKAACAKPLEEATAEAAKANEACIKAGASYIVLGAAATATIAALF